ncbi:MAG TPA: cytochrome c3 family protein [Deltaproteobacteria bacterium]|jgi:hypothetical protein|nr:cytochrome c3 family protein [Deltaproteobacteria bacterium]HOI07345.1 cytochrome c3 family protein [Deltaproteobacteria bacterium]
MKTWRKPILLACGIILVSVVLSVAVTAGGPPLKADSCGVCHQDYGKIMPGKHPDVGKAAACLTCHAPDPAKNEATSFSTNIHSVHQGGKTKLECSSCHAL